MHAQLYMVEYVNSTHLCLILFLKQTHDTIHPIVTTTRAAASNPVNVANTSVVLLEAPVKHYNKT